MGVRTALCLALVSSHRLALALLTPHIRSFSCIAHSLGRSSHRTDEHCLIAHQCRSSGGLQCSSRLLHEQAIDSSAILTSIGVAGSLAIIALAALVKLSSSVNSSTGAALYEYNVDPTDKSYIFDESIPRDEFQVPAPMYLISALLSGLNALPVEAALKDGSQRGRRVQYKSYRRMFPLWIPIKLSTPCQEFASVTSCSLSRLVDLPSMDEDKQLLGRLRMYRFMLLPSDAELVNKSLFEQLASARLEGMDVSNAGGFHSTTDLFSYEQNALLGNLTARAVTMAEKDDYTVSSAAATRPQMQNVVRAFQSTSESEGWINRNGHGHWNSLHTHTGCAWSGIYYARSALDASRVSHSGALLIKPSAHVSEVGFVSDVDMCRLNAVAAASMSASKDDDIPRLGRCDFMEITPQSGMMLVFPGYLQHAVLPLCIKEECRGLEEGTRVSFAFNYSEQKL